MFPTGVGSPRLLRQQEAMKAEGVLFAIVCDGTELYWYGCHPGSDEERDMDPEGKEALGPPQGSFKWQGDSRCVVRRSSKLQYSDTASLTQKDRCWSEVYPAAGVLGMATEEVKLGELDCAYPTAVRCWASG